MPSRPRFNEYSIYQPESAAQKYARQRADMIAHHIAHQEAVAEETPPAPKSEQDIFAAESMAMPAPVEFFAICIDTLTRQQVAHSPRAQAEQRGLPLSTEPLEGMILPTMSNPKLRIPIGLNEHAQHVLYLPNMTPLNHRPHQGAGTLTPGWEFGHSKVFSLLLNEQGDDLLAFTNQPYDHIDELSPDVTAIINQPDYELRRTNFIGMLRQFRNKLYPEPIVADLPGATYSAYGKAHKLVADPQYRGFNFSQTFINDTGSHALSKETLQARIATARTLAELAAEEPEAHPQQRELGTIHEFLASAGLPEHLANITFSKQMKMWRDGELDTTLTNHVILSRWLGQWFSNNIQLELFAGGEA